MNTTTNLNLANVANVAYAQLTDVPDAITDADLDVRTALAALDAHDLDYAVSLLQRTPSTHPAVVASYTTLRRAGLRPTPLLRIHFA